MVLSPLALVILAVMIVLALPAKWMLCRVALDLPALGLALVAACGAAIYVMEPHHGPSLVDATMAFMGLTGAVIALASLAGGWLWLRRPAGPPELPSARLIRP